jgi:hypothetical protein
MKTSINILLMILACYIAGLFLPWWSGMLVIASLSFFLNFTIKQGAAIGAAVLGTLWLGLTVYSYFMNSGILTSRIGVLFQGLSSSQLILVAFVIASISGSFAGMAGSGLRKLIS